MRWLFVVTRGFMFKGNIYTHYSFEIKLTRWLINKDNEIKVYLLISSFHVKWGRQICDVTLFLLCEIREMKKTKLNTNKETKKGEVFTRKSFWWHIVNSDTGRQNCWHKLRKGLEIAEIKGRQTKSHLFPPSAPNINVEWFRMMKSIQLKMFSLNIDRGGRGGLLFFPRGGRGGVIFSFSFF